MGESWGLECWRVPRGWEGMLPDASVFSSGDGMRAHQLGSLGTTDGAGSPATNTQNRRKTQVSVCGGGRLGVLYKFPPWYGQ